MLNLLLILIITGIFTVFLGYIIHKLFHNPSSRWFYHAHMNHHMIQYPPTSFFSDSYKSAGKDSTVILFVIAFAPILLGVIALTFFGVFSLTTCIASLLGLVFWGWMHNYVHDHFHLKNTWLTYIPFFIKWRKLHYIHHLDMTKNLGIIWFGWDKLFKTFADEDVELN